MERIYALALRALQRRLAANRLPTRFSDAAHRMRAGFGWSEFATLAALCVVAAGLFAFFEILDAVNEGDAARLDHALLLALRADDDPSRPLGPSWLAHVFRDLTALGGYAVLTVITMIAAGYLMILRRWPSVILVVGSVASGTLLNTILKGTLARPRPDIVTHLVSVETASLPSGHAMLAAVTYLTLGAMLSRAQTRRRLKLYIIMVSIILTLLVGFSRVYLGVHWPSDVLAGWSLGAAWAMACWLTAQFLEQRPWRAFESEDHLRTPKA